MARLLLPLLLLIFTLSPVSAQTGPANAQLEAAVNQLRTTSGETALRTDARLRVAAQQKIDYMVTTGCLLARCVNEPSAYERQIEAGYPSTGFAAELIDRDHLSAIAAATVWNNEGSATRFLLHQARFTDIGCAHAEGTFYWVCDLSEPTEDAPSPTTTPTPPATATAVPTPTPTATPIPPTATPTATPLPPTLTPTATLRPPVTPVPMSELGECSIRWRNPSNGSEYAVYIGVMTRQQCVSRR